MKKIITPILLLSTLLISCGNDDDGGSSNDLNQPTINGEFEDTEESKAALEENAIEALEKIEAFNNDNAFNEIVELTEFLNIAEEDDNNVLIGDEVVIEPSSSILNSTLTNINSLASKQLEISEFNAAQANTITSTQEEDFNEDTGIYDWDEEIEDFIKIADSDDQIYNIAYNGKNAVFSITEFKTSINPNEDELPSSVESNLVIDGVTVFEQTHTASFDTDTFLPNSYTSSIELGELNLISTLSNNGNNSITETISIEIGDCDVFYLGSNSKGDFDEIDNDGDTESNIEDILSTSDFTLSFLNASVTFEGEIPGDFDSDAELSEQEGIDLLNDNLEIALSVDNKLVASGEFYLDMGDENIRFKFPDDSTADFDTYFNDDFTSVEDKLDSVFDLFSESTEDIDL